MPLVSLCILRKQEISVFLFSESMERDQWHEMDSWRNCPMSHHIAENLVLEWKIFISTVKDSLFMWEKSVYQRLMFCRYQPHTILPRCRFLLPLSKKRHSFIKEMLRKSERPAPRYMAVINVDRRKPVSERDIFDPSSTVFMQIYYGLKSKDSLHYRYEKSNHI